MIDRKSSAVGLTLEVSIAIGSLRQGSVQRQIQPQHIYARFAQDAKLPPIGGFSDKRADRSVIQAARFSDSRNLEFGVLHADMGIQSTAG